MDSNKKEAIFRLIAMLFASVLGGFIFYWGFSLIFWVIKYALQG